MILLIDIFRNFNCDTVFDLVTILFSLVESSSSLFPLLFSRLILVMHFVLALYLD